MSLRRAVAAAAAAVWALSGAHTLLAQEPYWESQPLSYWVSALSGQDAGGRVRAASSLAEMALAHGGIALLAGSTWMLLALVPAVAVMDRLIIAREERYLERRFGAAYADYCRRVRRWL